MEHKAYYAIIPASVRYSKEVPDGAKLLYGEITALCNERGHCWATNAYFAELYGKSSDTISRWISALARAGFIFALVDNEAGNSRQIWLPESQGGIGKNAATLSAKMPKGYRQKCSDPIGKNAEQNNTVNITLNNTEEEKDAALFSSSSELKNSILKAEKKEVGTSPGAGGAARGNDYDFAVCDQCHGVGYYTGRNGRETCEKCGGSRTITKPKNGALEPPFTPTGETIEPQGATIFRMTFSDLPGVTIVDSVPGTYTPQTDERANPPEALQRVNIPEQIAILKTDAAALETFAMVRKIPSNLFPEYVEAFSKEIAGTGETYPNQKNFRKHFFNWCGTRYEIAQKRMKSNGNGRSHINQSGGDLSKYQEKQKF